MAMVDVNSNTRTARDKEGPTIAKVGRRTESQGGDCEGKIVQFQSDTEGSEEARGREGEVWEIIAGDLRRLPALFISLLFPPRIHSRCAAGSSLEFYAVRTLDGSQNYSMSHTPRILHHIKLNIG